MRHHPLQKHQSITPQSLHISFSKRLCIPPPRDPRPSSHPHSDEAKAKQCTKIRGGLGPEARCPKLYVQATSKMKICEARVLRCLCDKAFIKTDNFSCSKTLCSGHLKNEGLRSESRGCTLSFCCLNVAFCLLKSSRPPSCFHLFASQSSQGSYREPGHFQNLLDLSCSSSY